MLLVKDIILQELNIRTKKLYLSKTKTDLLNLQLKLITF
jgi:hypothetical protein